MENESQNEKIQKICKILVIASAAVGIASLVIFIPAVRNFIIDLGEWYVGRPLTREVWHGRFIKWEVLFLIFILVLTLTAMLFTQTFYPLEFTQNQKGIFHARKITKSVFRSKTHGLEFVFLFLACVGVRVFFISQKKSLHVDESLSIAICNRNEYGFWGKTYDIGKEYTGKELKSISLWDDASARDAISDVAAMHKDNHDSPHTNFYYSLLRLWFMGTKTSDLRTIFYRGGFLNIVFFTISFFLMLLLIMRFTTDRLKTCLCLAIAFLNPASLSLTVFLRPYELQQVFVIGLTYYVVCIVQAMAKNEPVATKRNFCIGSFCLALTLLSAYFNFILVGLYGFVFIITAIRKKDFNLLKFFLFMFASSLVIAKILYFGFGKGLFDYRGTETFSKLSPQEFFMNVKNTLGFFLQRLKNVPVAMVILLLAFCFAVSVRKEKSSAYALVICVTLASVFLVMLFSPGKTLRYIAPLVAIFAVICTHGCDRPLPDYFLSAAAAVLICVSLVPTSRNPTEIEHIDDAWITAYTEIQETTYPIFVRGTSNWRYAMLVPYLRDDCKVIFVDRFSEIEESYPDRIPCLFLNQDDDSSEKFLDDAVLSKLQKRTPLSYFDVFFVGAGFSQAIPALP